VFKGGTALKKCYFSDYRFSEDLDFTLTDSSIAPEKIIAQFKQIFSLIKLKSNITLEIKNHELNKHNDLSFFINFIGPLEGSLGSRDLKVDITYNEKIINKVKLLPILIEYSDLSNLKATIYAYSLEEIFIEKLCALIGRTQPRDLYDLWYLLENSTIRVEEEWKNFLQKAKSNNIKDPDITKTLNQREKTLEEMWDKFLAHQMHDLPYYNDVMRSMKRYFR